MKKHRDLFEVLVIHVSVDAEEAFEDGLGDGKKVLWEGNP